MSVCLCSFRALSRSRTSTRTLTPFLYQTATIQQRSPISRRNASDSSRPSRSDYDVPFEGEELPPAVNDSKVDRKSTITGSERAAFEKLYKNYQNAEQKEWNEHELDQIADEYYEDDDDNANDQPQQSIDSIFDAVLTNNKPSGRDRFAPVRSRSKSSSDLGSVAKDILKGDADKAHTKKREEAAKKQARAKELRSSEQKRVRALLEAAPSDQALWAVLDKEVFSVIRGMNLDIQNPAQKLKTSRKSKNPPKTSGGDLSPTDPTIFYPLYSSHLVSAAHVLRTNFPASPLIFNILPTVKSLGRSSYALGANTQLYKVLLLVAFRQNHSYTQICSLLQDMDNGGIEYDFSIAAIVDEVLSTHYFASRGHYGRPMDSVVGLEMFDEGEKKLRAWRGAIRKRLGESVGDKGLLPRRIGPRFKGVGKMKGRSQPSFIFGDNVQGGGSGAGTDEDIPLVEEEGATFSEERAQQSDAVEMSPDIESFMRDSVGSSADVPSEGPDEAPAPSAEDVEEEARKRGV